MSKLILTQQFDRDLPSIKKCECECEIILSNKLYKKIVDSIQFMRDYFYKDKIA